ncbi:MAG: tetratricopeptide repeat protein [Myxococcota bacterium]
MLRLLRHSLAVASFVALVWGQIVGTAASVVAAPRPAPTAEQEKLAVITAEQAKAKFTSGAYAEAAKLFMQAYAQFPEPTLVFNAARSYQRAGQLAQAMPLFQLYLSLDTFDDPDSVQGRREAEQHLAAIQKELTARETAKAAEAARPKPPDVTPPPKPADTGKPATETTPTTVKPAPPQEEDRPAPIRRPGLFARIEASGWTRQEVVGASTAAVGATLLVTATVLTLVARSGLADLDDRLAAGRSTVGGETRYTGVTQREVDDALRTHDSRQAWATGLAVVGIAAVGTGLALWWLGDEEATVVPVGAASVGAASASWRVLPALAANGSHTGLLLQGRF